MVGLQVTPKTRGVKEAVAAERWDEAVRRDHQRLKNQADVLDSALGVQVGDQDRRVVLSWVLRSLWPELELHLRKEEEALLRPLAQLLGRDSRAVAMLRKEHADLRASFRHLAELLQDPDPLEWDRIELAVDGFRCLLEEHEKLGDHLLLDVLRYSLAPKELDRLMEVYRRVEEKAHEEEGWPKRKE